MKVVYLVGWYYPENIGGTEAYVASLARGIAALGHDVAVAAPNPNSSTPYTYEHEGIPVFRYPIPLKATAEEAQARVVVRGAEHLHEYLVREKPDIIHLHSFTIGMGIWEIRVARRVASRVIVTAHISTLGYTCLRGTLMRAGHGPCDGQANPSKCTACVMAAKGIPAAAASILAKVPVALSKRVSGLGRLGTLIGFPSLVAVNMEVQKELLSLVDRFVVLTDWAKDVLIRNGAPERKITVNRLGCDDAILTEGRKSLEPGTDAPVKIGYLGRYDKVKGVYEFARAIRMLPRDLKVQIEFRGPVFGPHESQRIDEVKAIVGEDERVTFGSRVPEEKIGEVLRGYDVLCCPSICAEGGPTVALEAQAVGTPVIGSRIGGLAEIVKDDVDGALVEPGDAAGLASLITRIARDPNETVDRWRKAVPQPRTMHEVVEDYVRLYTE